MKSISYLVRIAMAVGCVTFSALQAQEQWKFSVYQYDRRETYIDQQSVVLGVPCSTRLKFTCTQDKKGSTGYLSMDFTVAPFPAIKDFDFDFFQGPDAPVGGKKLLTITLSNAGKEIRFQEGLSGWYSAEIEDGFVFGAGTPTKNKTGYMRKIVEQIIAGAESIEVAVTDGKNSSKIVSVMFPVTSGRGTFESLLNGSK